MSTTNSESETWKVIDIEHTTHSAAAQQIVRCIVSSTYKGPIVHLKGFAQGIPDHSSQSVSDVNSETRYAQCVAELLPAALCWDGDDYTQESFTRAIPVALKACLDVAAAAAVVPGIEHNSKNCISVSNINNNNSNNISNNNNSFRKNDNNNNNNISENDSNNINHISSGDSPPIQEQRSSNISGYRKDNCQSRSLDRMSSIVVFAVKGKPVMQQWNKAFRDNGISTTQLPMTQRILCIFPQHTSFEELGVAGLKLTGSRNVLCLGGGGGVVSEASVCGAGPHSVSKIQFQVFPVSRVRDGVVQDSHALIQHLTMLDINFRCAMRQRVRIVNVAVVFGLIVALLRSS